MTVRVRQTVDGVAETHVVEPHGPDQSDDELLAAKADGAADKGWAVTWTGERAFTATKDRWGGTLCVREFWTEQVAVGFVASATSGSQASVASFNIGTLGTGARAGIVFVAIHNSATDIITGVTWNGVAMNVLYSATDTDTEPGVVKAYFLDNVTNGTITVSRTNNAVVTVGYAASISGASTGLEAYQTITRVSSTQNTNANTSTTGTGASGEVAVDDGSPGTNSMRFSAAYSGGATPPLQGTNSTNLQLLDSTALGSRFVRETTAGQGSRNVGFATGTTDDWALVAVAVREIPPVVAVPTAASLTLTGSTPTVLAPAISQPTAAAMVLTGGTPPVYSGAYAQAVMADSPVGYWRLGEASGTTAAAVVGPDGTYDNTPTLGVAGLVVGGNTAATFTRASNEQVDLPSGMPAGGAAGSSIEAWVKFTSLPVSGEQIIAHWGGAGTAIHSLTAIHDGTNVYLQWVYYNGSVNTSTGFTGAGFLVINTTYHVVYTHDYAGQVIACYVNSVSIPVFQPSTGASAPTAGGHSSLAKYWGNNVRALDATLDEVAFYGTALSSARVLAHYNAGVGPISSQPTAASLVLTGSTPTVTTTANVTAVPDAASLVITGGTPVVTAPALSLPTAAALVVTGAVPDVVAGTSDNKTAVPDAAALTLTGATPAVSAAQAYVPDAAALVLAGATPTVASPQTYAPTAAALVLTGSTPVVTTPTVSQPTAVNLVMTGATPTVTATANWNIVPGPLGLTLTGSVPDVIATGAATGGHHGSSVRRGLIRPVTIPAEVRPDDDELLLLGVL